MKEQQNTTISSQWNDKAGFTNCFRTKMFVPKHNLNCDLLSVS